MSRQSANEFATVELVNMVQRRRWPFVEKLLIVEEALLPGMNISFVTRKHDAAPLFRWRELMGKGGKKVIAADAQAVRVAAGTT